MSAATWLPVHPLRRGANKRINNNEGFKGIVPEMVSERSSNKKLGLDSKITSWDLKNGFLVKNDSFPGLNSQFQFKMSRNPYFLCLYKNFGFKHSGWTLEFRSLVGIGRSGWMIGSLCLDMVPKLPHGSKLWSQEKFRKHKKTKKLRLYRLFLL